MWYLGEEGIEFSGPRQAYEVLRDHARQTIDEGDRQGVEMRQVHLRLRNDIGEVLFDGTLEDAASIEIDGRVFLPKV